MVAQLIRQFGLETASLLDPDPSLMLDLEQRTYNVFHVRRGPSDHRTSRHRSALLSPYGIASVLGFGGVLPSGELVAVLLFSKVSIPVGTADFFKTVALNVKYALSALRSSPACSPRRPKRIRCHQRNRAASRSPL